MRIGIYKDTLANGRGADVAVLALARGLRERGHDAVVFEKTDLYSRLGESWDVIVSAGTNELLDIDGFSDAPVVQQFHTDPRSQFKWKRFFRNRKIRAAISKVSVVQVLREEHVGYVAGYGVPVEVIGNWTAYDADKDAGAVPEDKMILYPAAFSRKKNHALLLRAFSDLLPDFPDWTIELHGDGPKPRELPSNVLIKPRGDLRSAYDRCAFLAFPSIDEGFGLVIAEAAAFAKPAVMVRDWIGTGAADGAVVTDRTVSAYADGMRLLMSDAAVRHEMGRNACIFCAGRYSRRKILDKWERLLYKVRDRTLR